MNRLIGAAIIGVTILLVSCRVTSESAIERNEFDPYLDYQIAKLVVVEPDVYIADTRESNQEKYLKSSATETILNNSLVQIGRKHAIDVTIIDGETLPDTSVLYFEQVIKLKRQIELANTLQDPPLFWKKEGAFSRPYYSYENYAPFIGADFSGLAKRFDTPYFSVAGVYSVKQPNSCGAFCYSISSNPLFGIYRSIFRPALSYFYIGIVDVTTGEIVYREGRQFYGEVHEARLSNIISRCYKRMKLPAGQQ